MMVPDIPVTAVVVLVAALGGIPTVLAGWLMVGSLLIPRRAQRRARLHRELQPRLRDLGADPTQMAEVAGSLGALRWHEQTDQLAASVETGTDRQQVLELARLIGLLGRADEWGTSRRWHLRLRAARLWTLTGGGRGRMLSMLDDPHPEVRSQAAEWVALHGDVESLGALLSHLDGDLLLRDFVLVDCLSRAGAKAVPALIDFLADDEVVDPVPALTVAANVAGPAFAPSALRWSRAESAMARAAAVRLLAAIANAAAVTRLRELVHDEAEIVRAASVEGLGRLRHRPAAPDLATALSDPAFAVRRGSALALRQLGAAGELYLRRGSTASDPFARDMARQVLSLPREVGS